MDQLQDFLFCIGRSNTAGQVAHVGAKTSLAFFDYDRVSHGGFYFRPFGALNLFLTLLPRVARFALTLGYYIERFQRSKTEPSLTVGRAPPTYVTPSLTRSLPLPVLTPYRQSHQSRSDSVHQSMPIGWPSGGSLAFVRFILFGSSWKRLIW